MTLGAWLALPLLISAAGEPAHDISGEVSVRGQGFITRATPTDPDAIGWATLLVKDEARLGKLRLTASARAEWISSEDRGPLAFDPADRQLRRSPLSLRELSLRIPVAPALDLTAGRLLLGWGKTDGYSPADAFLPRDLSDPFADEKLPLWGLRVTGQRGPVRLDAFGAAVTTPWRLPVLSGRYAPLPLSRVHLVDGESDPPATGFAALRLLGSFGAWDVGAWGRAGVRPAPLLAIRPDLAYLDQGGRALPADRRYAHEAGGGIEASHVTGPWVLRAELGGLHSSTRELGDAWLATAGLERGFGDSTLIATLATNLEATPIDPALLFDRAILPAAIVAWNVSRDWGGCKLYLARGFKHGDGLLKVEGTHDLDDAWSLAGGIDWPHGSRAGALGALRDARRAWALLRRRW